MFPTLALILVTAPGWKKRKKEDEFRRKKKKKKKAEEFKEERVRVYQVSLVDIHAGDMNLFGKDAINELHIVEPPRSPGTLEISIVRIDLSERREGREREGMKGVKKS